MAARRENIEAYLRVRNAQRFKAEIDSVARSVGDVGKEARQAATRLDIMKKIEKQTGHQSEILTAVEESLARSIDTVGDKAQRTTRSLGLMDLMQRRVSRGSGGRGGGLLGLIGISGRLKDTLSLTGGEVKATAITMAAYLSPALIELASSASAAMLGVGIVGGSGIAALLVGLSGAGIVAVQAAGQFKKVKTAQDAYNISVAQYGEGSKQAATAAAHMYAVIQNNGGAPVLQAIQRVNRLKKAWKGATGPARSNMLGIMNAGLGGATRLLPTFARETNRNTGVMKQALGGAFNALSGKEMQKNIANLSHRFRQMFGPLVRGSVNLIIAMFRLIRVAAPYAVEFAKAFEGWTKSVRSGSRDTGKLQGFVFMLVENTTKWWNLLRAVGRLLITVFKGSQSNGQDLVVQLTDLVNRFDHWLNMLGPNGQTRIKNFFDAFDRQLQMLFSNPGAWLDQFIPLVGNMMARAALYGGKKFIEGWLQMDIGGKIFVVALLMRKAIFTRMGALAAGYMASAFAASSLGSSLAVTAGIAGAAAGTAASAAFVAALTIGLPAVIVIGASLAIQSITIGGKHLKAPGQSVDDLNLGGGGRNQGGGVKGWLKRHQHITDFIPGLKHPKAAGGTIPWGTSALVGEAGPELASAGVAGMNITPRGFSPMGGGGLRSMESLLSVSDMLPPVHVHVNMNRREVGRANVDWKNETKARRGGRPTQD